MKTRKDEMRDQAQAFHDANPIIWELFVRFTMDRIGHGFKNFSGQAIWERIRWETGLPEYQENNFKLNNNHVAFYTRRFMTIYPQYHGFFRKREQQSERAPATGLPELTPAEFGDCR